jgi:hypothetical protein
MSGGQQANFGQGAVNVLGDETEGTMVGSSSTASPGSFGKSVFMRLRSKKIIDSATSRTLTGSALSGVQGAFGKTRTMAVTGSVSNSQSGSVTASSQAQQQLDSSSYLQFGEKLKYGTGSGGAFVPPDSPNLARQNRLFTNASVEPNSLPWWWKNASGTARATGPNWWDANGTVQGTVPFASATINANVPGQAVVWSGSGMAALIQKIMDEGIAGITISVLSGTGTQFCTKDHSTPSLRPQFNIVTNLGTYNVGAIRDSTLSSSSDPTWGFDQTMAAPYLIKPNLSTVQGTVSSATMTLFTSTSTQTIPATYRLFALKTDPIITDPANQLGGVEYGLAAQCENDLQLPTKFPSQVLFYPSFASQAACEAAGWTEMDFANGDPDLDSFQHVKEYGLNLMRIKSRYPGHPFSDGSTLVSWRWPVPGGRKEAYVRFLFRLSQAARNYINEIGVKMPGFEGTFNGAQTLRMSYRSEHMPPSDANPHIYALARHAYDAENPQSGGFAENRPFGNACILAGNDFANIYSFEFRVKMNTLSGGVWQADGIDEAWVNGVKVYSDITRKIIDLVAGFGGDDTIASFFLNYYHGGSGNTPTGIFTADLGGVCVATQYIGPPPVQSLERDINGNSWATTWNASNQRTDMQYSNAHQHTDGRQLEFAMALHSRSAGDNTSVRWADFSSTSAPTGGYLWASNDPLIAEHDNFATAYLPWKGWVALFGRNGASFVGALISGQKIISIDGTPSAIFRNVEAANADPDGNITDYVDVVYPSGAGLTAIAVDDKWHNTNYNPACWVNPTGTMTGWWGGGYGSSFPGSGNGSVFKLLDDNPNYPGSSTKPLRLRVFRPTGKPSPMLTRHMVQIGDWLYWGGGMVNADGSSTLYANDTAKFANSGSFYRIKVSDLANLVFTQEQITSAPVITPYPNLPAADNNIRYNLLCADTTRKWLIYGNVNGFYRYKVPDDDGNDGTWEGPITFGMTSNQWASTISEGGVDLSSSPNWHGLIGTHRSDLNQTFFRYNLSKRWNRIRWTN